MRILHVIAEMDPSAGGVCQAVRLMVTGLKELNVYNEVVSLDDPDASFLKNDSFKVNALGKGKGPWKYNANLIPWLSENLSRFDCVITHGLWLHYTYAVRKTIQNLHDKALSLQQSNAVVPKSFVMPHGMLDPYFQKASGRKVKAIRNWFYWKLVEQKVIDEANGILFTCEDELRLARTTFHPYRPKQEIVVGLGIENPPANRPSMREAFLKKCPGLHDSPYILFLSRIHEKKGVDLLLIAYADVANEIKENNQISNSDIEIPKLVIAGPGLETHYGQSIQKIVLESEELKNNVFFPGMLTADAKWGAFYNCEVFALPSHQENFGIAIVEAMACNKPVLISNQVNIWREIEEGGGGFIADDTLEATRVSVRKWVNLTKEEKELLGRSAFETYERKFAIIPVAQKLSNALS